MMECPPESKLRQLLDGPFIGAEYEKLRIHVEQCPACDGALQRLTSAGDPGMKRLEYLLRPPEPPPGNPSTRSPANLPTIPGYEILEKLGRGGMGVVYKAKNLQLGRTVAIKLIRTEMHGGADHRDQVLFEHEAKKVASL